MPEITEPTKKTRGRKKGYKVQKKNVAAVCDVRPNHVEDPDPVRHRESSVLAIDERNPFVLAVAKEWERLEAVIEDARSKQVYLQKWVEREKAS